jgi:Uma2 family endonuclease
MEVMGVPQVDRLYTAEDLAQLGDAFRGELIEGRLVPISPSKRLHGVVCANVATELGMWCRIRDPGFRLILGECGFIVARRPDVVLVPDLALVARARDAILDDPFLPGFGAAVSQLVM